MISGRGIVHVNTFAAIPNVRIKILCDVDERLFPTMVNTVEKLFGEKPSTEFDFRKREDLDNDILEGHMSAALGHLGVISYRTGRKIVFNPESEKFVRDREADKLLTRTYREPYLRPDKI